MSPRLSSPHILYHRVSERALPGSGPIVFLSSGDPTGEIQGLTGVPHAIGDVTLVSLSLDLPSPLNTVKNSGFPKASCPFSRVSFHMALPLSSVLFLTPHHLPKSSKLSLNATSPGSSQDGWFLFHVRKGVSGRWCALSQDGNLTDRQNNHPLVQKRGERPRPV